VGQTITDFGRTSNLVASSRLHAQAQQESATATRADVLLQVNRGYLGALRSQTVLVVAEQTVAARQLIVDQITTLANSKLRSGLDVSFANVNLSEAKLLLANAQNDVKSSFAELSTALGFRDQRSFDLAEPSVPGALPDNAVQLVADAMQARPELASYRDEHDSALRLARAERALSFPSISGIATAGVLPAHEDFLHSRYAAAGVNVNIPIFNGHLFSARRTEAELRAQAAEQNLRETGWQIADLAEFVLSIDGDMTAEEVRSARDTRPTFDIAKTKLQALSLVLDQALCIDSSLKLQLRDKLNKVIRFLSLRLVSVTISELNAFSALIQASPGAFSNCLVNEGGELRARADSAVFIIQKLPERAIQGAHW
jgi:AraC-like DNA-binding protein